MKMVMRVFCVLIAAVIFSTAVLAVSLDEPMASSIRSDGEDAVRAVPVTADVSESGGGLSVPVRSAILIEATSGKVLYEQDADIKLPPASITKIMTMLLIMEAIDNGSLSMNDMVTTSEKAKKMTGSRIFLDTGEQMSVHDMLKGIAVASGNDAAVAMAEHMMGSEEAFVARMNGRAAELGMTNTQFKNAHGLDEDGHYSSARDVAIMSRELFRHETIIEFTSLWMDSLRDGQFELVNTNRLIRFYPGANGLKTGSTDIAKYCLSAAAKRDGMQLIAVVLAAENTTDRFESAKKLLDYGFANYGVMEEKAGQSSLGEVRVLKGKVPSVSVRAASDVAAVVPKGKMNQLRKEIDLQTELEAPVEAGSKVGSVEFWLGDEMISSTDLILQEASGRLGVVGMFWLIIGRWVSFK